MAKRLPMWIEDILAWKQMAPKRYSLPLLPNGQIPADGSSGTSSSPSSASSSPAPAHEFVALVDYFCTLKENVLKALHADAAASIIANTILLLCKTLQDRKYWDGGGGQGGPDSASSSRGGGGEDGVTIYVGQGGLQLFSLDISYLLAAAAGYVSTEGLQAAQELRNRAVLSYCEKTGQQDPAKVLFPQEWFTKLLRQHVKTTILEYHIQLQSSSTLTGGASSTSSSSSSSSSSSPSSPSHTAAGAASRFSFSSDRKA